LALTFRDLAWVRRTTAGPGHDANGNRSEVDNSAVNLTAVDITTDNQDRLLQYGAVTYTYTDNGEVATRGSTTFSWDAVGNLQEVDPPGAANTIEYVYDARDRRVGKLVDGIRVQGFLYGDQLNPVAELDGGSNVVRRFVYGPNGNAPDYMVTIGTGSVHRIITDQLGSVVMVVNAATGSVAQEITYDSWGRVLSDTAPGFQPFGFAGGIVDEDTGWVRFGARDYRPEVGAWVAKDPLGFAAGDANLFRYVAGDPVNWIDPSGEAMDTVSQGCRHNYAMCVEAGLRAGNLAAAGGLAGAAARAAAYAPRVCQSVGRGADALVRVGGCAATQTGKAGERAVRAMYDIGLEGQKIVVNGRSRFPDGLTEAILSEVKNVRYLANTRQLQDFLAWAQRAGQQFDLYVRPGAPGAGGTTLSGPLRDLVAKGLINLKYIP
jgi:RHS repeat-associated protein